MEPPRKITIYIDILVSIPICEIKIKTSGIGHQIFFLELWDYQIQNPPGGMSPRIHKICMFMIDIRDVLLIEYIPTEGSWWKF